MSALPKVSIITVVYNDIGHIENTIQNVLEQTYSNIEYIVVDGASTDGTLDVIKKYQDKIIWKSEPDKGIYDAMMKGTRMATGEWILFRNSGDFFSCPTVIEEVFSNYEDKGEDFIAGNIRYLKGHYYKDMVPHILSQHYFEAMPFHHPATFIRRTTQLKYPFHLEYRNSADYCFFIEALDKGATYKTVNLLIALFDANAGASTTNYDKSLIENIEILKAFNAPSTTISDRINRLKKWNRNAVLRRCPLYRYIHNYYILHSGGWKPLTEDKIGWNNTK